MAVGEVLEPWESAEVGVDVVMYHLEGARVIAHHGEIYKSNAETKLQGKAFMFDSGSFWKIFVDLLNYTWLQDQVKHLFCFMIMHL